MKTIVLNFSGIRKMWALHSYLKSAFSLPDYYGYNLDALWDCLIYAFSEETLIQLKNLSALPNDMAETAGKLKRLFTLLAQKDPMVHVEFLEDENGAEDGTYLI